MKKTYTSSLIFIVLTVPLIVGAQTTHVVYLKNSKALYGNYSLNLNNKEVKLEISKDSTVIIPFDSISTIATDPQFKLEKRRVYGVVKGGINTLNATLGLSISSGFAISRKFKIGAGLELHKSLAQQEPQKIYLTEYMPVFAEIRNQIDKEKGKPYFLLQAGYGFVIQNQLDFYELNDLGVINRMKQGGAMAGLFVGSRYATKMEGITWFWEAGIKVMGYSTQTTYYSNGTKNRIDKTEYIPYFTGNIGFMW